MRLSGRVPQICCLHGPSAAGGAYMPAFTDWVGMVEGNASMYLASPRVAEKVTGEVTTLEEMGGAMMHATCPAAATRCSAPTGRRSPPPACCFDYLPSSFQEAPAVDRVEAAEHRGTGRPDLVPTDPNVAYDVRDVIDRFVDGGSFLEIKARWAQEMVTGLARLDGRVVGIVANQPSCAAARSSSTRPTRRRVSSRCATPTTSR